jgi:ribosomal protein L37E
MNDGNAPSGWFGVDGRQDTVPGIPMEPTITACPHCGCDTYHVRIKVTGTIREHHAFDERRVDNTGMWDAVRTRQRPTIYCSDCNRPIAKAIREGGSQKDEEASPPDVDDDEREHA